MMLDLAHFAVLACLAGSAVSANPVNTVRSLARRGAGDQPLWGYRDNFQYALDISVGTPPQTFPVRLGSSGFTYLLASNCADCPEGSARFDNATSSTWVQGSDWTMSGNPPQAGGQGSDTVTLGGYSTTTDLTTETTGNRGKGQYLHSSLGGSLRLWTPNSNNYRGDDLVNSFHDWPQPVMGLWLSSGGTRVSDRLPTMDSLAQPMVENQGQVTFGGTDTTKYQGAIMWQPRKLVDAFAGTVSDIKIGDTPIGGGSIDTIRFDWEYDGIDVPDSLAASIHAAISGARRLDDGQFIIPCSTNALLKITVSGIEVTIDNFDIIARKYPADESMCTSNIVAKSSNAELSFGTPFLHNIYSAYDYSKPAVGFAPLAADLSRSAPNMVNSTYSDGGGIAGASTSKNSSSSTTEGVSADKGNTNGSGDGKSSGSGMGNSNNGAGMGNKGSGAEAQSANSSPVGNGAVVVSPVGGAVLAVVAAAVAAVL